MGEGATDHVSPGMMVPPIDLPATDGRKVDFAKLSGRSVIAVYPWTGRPGTPNPPNWDDIAGAHHSTPELEGFRDLHARFAQEGAAVFGLSRQPADYQQEVVARLNLPFPLLSDARGSFSEGLSLPTFRTGRETYLKRLTLVVTGGRIEQVFFPVSDPAGHAAEVLAWLETQGRG
jgi:peroxiredoxin